MEIPNGELGFPEIKRDAEAMGPCWKVADDSIHPKINCPVVKRDADGQPCFEGPSGEVTCPVEKRAYCWEAPDGRKSHALHFVCSQNL